MIFDKNSFLVKIWLDKVNNNESNITINNVPMLFNLKEVVQSLIIKEWFFYVHKTNKNYKGVVYYGIYRR